MSGRARRATRPTSCHFGAALVRSPRELRADVDRWRDLARHRSKERCSGMPRSRPGMPTGVRYRDRGKYRMTDSSADARDPPTYCNQGAAVLSRPAPNIRPIVDDRTQRKPFQRKRKITGIPSRSSRCTIILFASVRRYGPRLWWPLASRSGLGKLVILWARWRIGRRHNESTPSNTMGGTICRRK